MAIKIGDRYFVPARGSGKSLLYAWRICEAVELDERRNDMYKKTLEIVIKVPAFGMYATRDAISRRLREAGIRMSHVNACESRTLNCIIHFAFDLTVKQTNITEIVSRIVEYERECDQVDPRVVASRIVHECMAENIKLKNPSNLYQKGLTVCKKLSRMRHMSSIKDVIFNPPATIVLWADGTKTVVKAQRLDTFDPTTGLAMAISKKHFGNDPYFNEIFRKFVPDYDKSSLERAEERFEGCGLRATLPLYHDRTDYDAKPDTKVVTGEAGTKIWDEASKLREEDVETCRERLKKERPAEVNYAYMGGCKGCPDSYGYAARPESCDTISCAECWGRPVEKRAYVHGHALVSKESVENSTEQVWRNNLDHIRHLDSTKKYEFTGETRVAYGRTLHRIRAVRDIYFPSGRLFVKKGELGGWIESEKNLSHLGSCWVGEEACVLHDAQVLDAAYVSGCAVVRNHAVVGQCAHICEYARVIGHAWVYGEAYIHGHALVYGKANVYVNAEVCDGAKVGGKTSVGRHCKICGKARITNPYLYSEVTIDG